MSGLRKQLVGKGISAQLPPRTPFGNIGKRGGRMIQRDFSPLSWEAFWDRKENLMLPDGRGTLNVYVKGDDGPVLLLLHGGGYSGLTWSCLARELSDIIKCRIVAPDLRGHGDTKTSDDSDLSADTQALDVRDCYAGLFPIDPPPIILIGHSMGGAIAVHAAAKEYILTLIGLIVIDVVEGSALEALKSMHGVLACRPKAFPSVEKAIEYSITSGLTRNLEAARVSMPSQIIKTALSSGSNAPNPANQDAHSHPQDDVITEEEEEDETKITLPSNDSYTGTVTDRSRPDKTKDVRSGDSVYHWRVDLAASEPHWRGWFKGLSALFLSVPAPKLLLLAGVDRLDRDLTVGQMQGKFQMVVLPKVGHAIHEDDPIKMAEAIASFCVRHRYAEAKAEFSAVYPGC